MPMVGLILYNAGTSIRGRESTALAALVGVVLFLGIAHAGVDVLVGNAYLKYEATPVLSAATAAGESGSTFSACCQEAAASALRPDQ